MRNNEFKISYSRINSYLFCPEKYRLIYIENRYIPLNANISFGISVHKALENYYKSGLYTWESMSDGLNSGWESYGYNTPQEVYVNYLRAQDILKNFWNKYGKYKPENMLTEKNFQTEIGKYKFIGIIDRIDQSKDGTHELVDYKTHKEIWSQQKIDEDLQLSLYAYACKTALGFIPDRIAIYFLSHNEKIYTLRDEQKIRTAVDLCVKVADKINNGEFEPDVSKCNFCDFRENCRYTSAEKDKEQK